MDLATAVTTQARCPCPRHAKAFLDALERAGEFPVVTDPRPEGLPPGMAVVEPVGAALAVAPVRMDARTWLLGYVDAASAVARQPRSWASPRGIIDVLRMVQTTHLDGLLVATDTDDDCWAAVTTAELTKMVGRLRPRF